MVIRGAAEELYAFSAAPFVNIQNVEGDIF